jgi:alanyl-tRNA synthetase
LNSSEIRQLYTGFFEERGHRAIPSSSLIPAGDPTLLFTSAGMVPLKPYMMGLAVPPAPRMTSVQKCFRTTDIEEVGDDSHCTFFEMLGNFSIGDYFKDEVIPWAWELLTAPQPRGLGLDRSRIWTTIFTDDEEAYVLWRKAGVPAERIVRYGEKDNYWFSGAVGPCGPNTEINYDFGVDQGCRRSDCHPNCDNPMPGGGVCNRFIELWNLVFMTLYQAEDGSRTPLPQRNVDTGAGLDRWSMPLLWEGGVDWQGKSKAWTRPPAIFDNDMFRPIIATVESASEVEYDAASEERRRAMRILAEHGRATAHLIADGVMPGNDGRGYVLRRLIRRAMYFGGSEGAQLSDVITAVINDRRGAYPELGEQEKLVLRIVGDEEKRFRETMERGGTMLMAELQAAADRYETILPGDQAFFLHDTFGFPIELTREVARRQGLEVDLAGFEAKMDEQQARSRAAARFEGDAERIDAYGRLGLPPTVFVGYDTTTTTATVAAIISNATPVNAIDASEAQVELVLDRTPFYAEGGGQVGDRGEIVVAGGARFVVEDTQAVGEGGLVAHVGRLVEGSLRRSDTVEARVDAERRRDTARNHTGTHILHAALRQVLGSHVRQAGSLVTPDRLRFDFTHLEAMAPHEIAEVEAIANEAVRANMDVHVEHQRYEDALAGGALAFFGDKYADTVRVVGVCEHGADHCFSRELCGGTHCHASGEVGVIVITGESSIGAGMRRIEALTGRAAIEYVREREQTLAGLGMLLRAPAEQLGARIEGLQGEVESLRRRLQAAERKAAQAMATGSAGGDGAAAVEAETIGGVNVVIQKLADAPNGEFLRSVGDAYKSRLGSAILLLAANIDGKPSFIAMATPDVAKRVGAGDVVKVAAQAAGGGGGGRPEVAQGGGSDPSKIDAALAAARQLIEAKLSS